MVIIGVTGIWLNFDILGFPVSIQRHRNGLDFFLNFFYLLEFHFVEVWFARVLIDSLELGVRF